MLASYERAAFFTNNARNRYYLNSRVVPTWIGRQDRFWYCRETERGCTYTVVDARTGTLAPLFDHDDLAAKLVRLTGYAFPPADLQLRDMSVAEDGQITFTAFGKRYRYDSRKRLEELGAAVAVAPLISPDGTREAFVRDYDVWLRDMRSGREWALTTDGEEFNAYGLKPSGSRDFAWGTEIQWSPDSSRLLTVQTDEREVHPLPFIEYVPQGGGRPRGSESRRAFPGDLHVPTFRMVILDAASGRQTVVRYPDLPATRMGDAPIQGARAWWSGDGQRAYFVDIARGEKTVRLISVDAMSGEATEIMRETNSAGYVELSESVYLPATIIPLPRRNQVIWYSERSGFAQLYLYDLANGQLVRRLTRDGYNVRNVLSVDEGRGEALIGISGREQGRNPYYQEIMRVDLDTGEGEILSQGDDNRFVVPDSRFGFNFSILAARNGSGVSPTGNYWIETRLRADRPSTSVIRARDGREVAAFEQARTNGMPAGFRLPEPVLVTASDGRTTLQGIIVRPSNFDPSRRYPVIDQIYGGPQASAVPMEFDGFAASAQSLAELGFIVVIFDGRGTIGRGRAFREESYGAMQTASNMEDHIAGIRQLAARYPYMDLDRVGVTGFSAGGYMAANAMLRFPDFFKVGVAGSGNHDQRNFSFNWGERYQGLPEGDNYRAQANGTYAGNLRGRLMIYHGMMDSGVHAGLLFGLVQDLEDQNRDFDLVIAPRAGHFYTGYGVRRGWDYFVRYLLGQEPPSNFRVQTDMEYSIEESMRRLRPAAPR
jgi:dipeptidyl aminopeptidase/acylaminoacyl peptidase